jgi:hypothetical protein
MPAFDVPLCLLRVREEVLMALGAESAEDEGIHRQIATRYLTQAVQVIEFEPEREYDWSSLDSEH